MKMFEPEARNSFVIATVAMNAREGTPPDYKAIQAPDIEKALQQLDAARMRNAYPHVMGRYDEHGRYCTYCPAIEAVKPGRFVLHPLAAEEHKRSRDYA